MGGRICLTDAVEWIAEDDEWIAFQKWRSLPLPTHLGPRGHSLEVQDVLPQDLFQRCLTRLRSGEWIAFGAWGNDHRSVEIDPAHWHSKWYNVWHNELGYADHGKAGFSSIVVQRAPEVRRNAPKAQTRAVLRRWMDEWCKAHPGQKIRREHLFDSARDAFHSGSDHDITKTLFAGLWRNHFPKSSKYQNRPEA